MLTAAQEASPVAEVGFLTAVASLAAERGLGAGVSSCSAQGQLPCGMLSLPRPGVEPVFPALAGRLSTTGHKGSSRATFYSFFFL